MFFLLLFLVACSGMQDSEKEKLRSMNAKGEFISRKHDECLYPLNPPTHRLRDKYPWERLHSNPEVK